MYIKQYHALWSKCMCYSSCVQIVTAQVVLAWQIHERSQLILNYMCPVLNIVARVAHATNRGTWLWSSNRVSHAPIILFNEASENNKDCSSIYDGLSLREVNDGDPVSKAKQTRGEELMHSWWVKKNACNKMPVFGVESWNENARKKMLVGSSFFSIFFLNARIGQICARETFARPNEQRAADFCCREMVLATGD